MKRPAVIMHNTVSLDGAVTAFDIDIGLHYRIAERYGADVHLIGSKTARTGIAMFGGEIRPEEGSDFTKPAVLPGDTRPLWAIADTRGELKGLLHVLRRSDYCRDIVVLVSKATPEEYLRYLEDRQYGHFVVGEDHVDYKAALALLSKRCGARKVLTDSGGKLNSILLGQGLVDEISILITPALAGNSSPHLFSELELPGGSLRLKLIHREVFDIGSVLLRYRVSGRHHP